MKVSDATATARDAITVKRVYADPYEKNGLTVIPAAIIGGGAGGGAGRDEKGQEGEGSGFGVTGRPAGAFVIEGNRVTWRRAVDPNRIILTTALVVMVYLLSRPRLARVRADAPSLRRGPEPSANAWLRAERATPGRRAFAFHGRVP
jgi:hypothetical protein